MPKKRASQQTTVSLLPSALLLHTTAFAEQARSQTLAGESQALKIVEALTAFPLAAHVVTKMTTVAQVHALESVKVVGLLPAMEKELVVVSPLVSVRIFVELVLKMLAQLVEHPIPTEC